MAGLGLPSAEEMVPSRAERQSRAGGSRGSKQSRAGASRAERQSRAGGSKAERTIGGEAELPVLLDAAVAPGLTRLACSRTHHSTRVLQEGGEGDAAVGRRAEAGVVHQVHRPWPQHEVHRGSRGRDERGEEQVRGSRLTEPAG
jgi:hypothetical protein